MRDSPAARNVLRKSDALIVVDVQIDFLPSGSLPVIRGQEVVEPLNRYLHLFGRKQLPVIATRDWHPDNHCSFQKHGGPWPVHCVIGSPGARFAPDLQLPPDTFIISKGTDRNQEAYSGFQASGTDLAVMLRSLGVIRLFIGGLATDYCVRYTALDALSAGFDVCLLQDAIRAVEVKPGDGAAAIHEMCKRGAVLITLEQLADA
jgi:nicotinamidase/pyrazinamidase